jgi:hypothetical protein
MDHHGSVHGLWHHDAQNDHHLVDTEWLGQQVFLFGEPVLHKKLGAKQDF